MIDMRSDTASLPTPEMMAAIQQAKLGDVINDEDPTVKELESLAAEIFGKEAALFTCSGTMSNQIAVMALTERGDEIIVGERSHIYNLEVAALATLSQVQARPVPFVKGYLDPTVVREAIMPVGVQRPRTKLICLENTYDLNRCYPMSAENTAEICRLAHSYGISVYLDGARIFNAAATLGVDVKDLVRDVDALQVCLTKGLGAPFGGLLVGSRAFIERCRLMRQRVGGGLRQGGIVAAPGIVALREMTKRVGEDHENAKALALGLVEIDPTLLDPSDVVANAVTVDVSRTGTEPQVFLEGLLREGIKAKRISETEFRFMTYWNIGPQEVQKALDAVKKVLHPGT